MENQSKLSQAQVGRLNHLVNRINRRAEKLGLPGFTVTVGPGEWVETDATQKPFEVFPVTVDGLDPHLAGWKLVGVVDHTLDEPVLTRVPGTEVDISAYRDGSNWCDHCKSSRTRLQTFVLHSESEGLRQVGRNCLVDFLGTGAEAEGLLLRAQWLAELSQVLDEEPDGGGYRGRSDDRIHSEWFVQHVAATVRCFGFLGRTKARENENAGCPTADRVLGYLADHKVAEREDLAARRLGLDRAVNDEDKAAAAAALAWARDLDPADDSEYLSNLGRIARADAVTYRHTGFLASVIPAHARHLGRVAERKARAAAEAGSEFFGEAGKRIKWKAATKRKPAVEGLTLTLVARSSWESTYGTTHFHKFLKDGRDVAVWFGSYPLNVAVGDVVKVDATVKEHNERDDVKQTVITRVAVVE